MGYKVVVECEACGKDFRVKSIQGRRSRDWYQNEDTHVSFCFNLMTEDQRQKVDGNYADAEIYMETVCEPCRKAIRDAVKAVIKKLNTGKK